MWTLILYSLVIVSQIECQTTTRTTEIQPRSSPHTTDLPAIKYVLNDQKKNVLINVKPNRIGQEEQNYIITVSRPSFLRISCNILPEQKSTINPQPKTLNAEIDNEDILIVMKTDSSVKSWKLKQSRKVAERQYEATIRKTTAENEKIRITAYSKFFQHVGYDITISLLNDTDVMLKQNKPISTTISKSTSRLFQYIFPDTIDMVLLTIKEESNTDQCSLVSVQPINSTVPQLYDEEENMRFGNGTMYQTMSKLSAIILKREKFPYGANIVLLSIKNKGYECRERIVNNGSMKGARKNVTICIETLPGDPLISTLVILSAYFGMCLVAVVTLCCFKGSGNFAVAGKVDTYKKNLVQQRDENKKKKSQHSSAYSVAVAKAGFNRRKKKAEREISMDTLDASNQSIRYIDQDDDGHDSNTGNEQNNSTREDIPDLNSAENKRRTFQKRRGLSHAQKKFWQETLDTEDELDGTSIISKTFNSVRVTSPDSGDTLVTKVVKLDKKKMKERRNDRSNVRVADLTLQDDQEYFSEFVTMRSEMFVWLIFLAGIYYTLPVFQLVFNYQETSLTSGNLDTCYYNYLCQYPYGSIADYGHVLSNIGYIICGLAFMGIVHYRSYKNKQLIKEFEEKELGLLHPKHTGIPESYGIFYALGAALMFEGILSGCYHVCPTETNFQFDTTFMYCISVLVFLKVYQFRHHDVTSTAHLVFLAIGVALIFEVVGVFTDDTVFWFFFIVFYITFVFVFIIQIYTNWSGDLKSKLRSLFKTGDGVYSCDGCTAALRMLFSIQPRKMLGSISVLAVNILLAVFFLTQVSKTQGVSRYILTILMVNMFLYVSHYISCKLYYRFKVKNWKPTEGIRWVTLVYGALSVSFMLAAAYFFKAELKSSKMSPAESRNLNAPCFVMIFDNHDIWHFLSAGGLFYLFMFILTLEDYNRDQQRDKIPVF